MHSMINLVCGKCHGDFGVEEIYVVAAIDSVTVKSRFVCPYCAAEYGHGLVVETLLGYLRKSALDAISRSLPWVRNQP